MTLAAIAAGFQIGSFFTSLPPLLKSRSRYRSEVATVFDKATVYLEKAFQMLDDSRLFLSQDEFEQFDMMCTRLKHESIEIKTQIQTPKTKSEKFKLKTREAKALKDRALEWELACCIAHEDIRAASSAAKTEYTKKTATASPRLDAEEATRLLVLDEMSRILSQLAHRTAPSTKALANPFQDPLGATLDTATVPTIHRVSTAP